MPTTIHYQGRELTEYQYVSLRLHEDRIQCDCGAPELGHAPDCTWMLAGDDFTRDFADLWAEQGEHGGRMVL